MSFYDFIGFPRIVKTVKVRTFNDPLYLPVSSSYIFTDKKSYLNKKVF